MLTKKTILNNLNNGKMMTSNSYRILCNPMNIDRNYTAYRFEGRKSAICKWRGCTCKCTKDDMGSVKVISPHAPLGDTLCYTHATFTECYTSENTLFFGTPTADGITISCELETSHNSAVSRDVLGVQFECMPTSDSSIEGLDDDPIEWKTRVSHSLQSVTKLFGAFQALKDNDYIRMDDTCGSHMHTGTSDNRIDFCHLFANVAEYFEAFGALYEYLDKMPNAKMREYFGRGFKNYTRTIRKDGDRYLLPCHDGNGKRIKYKDKWLEADDNLYGNHSFSCNQHYLTFNLQHSYSIEFRLARFENAAQYRKIAVVMHNVVLYLEAYDNNVIDRALLSKCLVALFTEMYPY